MDILTCQSIVQAYFGLNAPGARHFTDQNLVVDGESYSIRPDDTYALRDAIVAIEYEDTKRPVESITKYWWLLMCTSWLTHKVPLKCVLFPLRDDFVRSRIEVIPILGRELAAKYPGAFQFYSLMPGELTEQALHSVLTDALYPASM